MRGEKMLHSHMLSMDLGSNRIKIVVGKAKHKGAIEVKEILTEKTPFKSIEDGKILDFENVKNTISQMLKGVKSSKKAICTIQTTEAITREMILPILKKDMNELIQMEVNEYFPVNMDEYIIQPQVTHSFIENGIKKGIISVAALPKNIVEDYYKLMKELKLKPVAMDINFNAVAKLFSIKNNIINQNQDVVEKHIAVIDNGADQINLHIIQNGKTQFSRIIVKDNVYSDFLAEISRYFQYSTRQGNNQIDRVYLCGGNSMQDDFDKQVEAYMNIPTYNISDMSQVQWRFEEQISDFINAIGALIRK